MEQTPVGQLVAAAAAGDSDAWVSIVDRYSPLLASVVAGYRLSQASRQDVAQMVWLRLVEHLTRLRSAEALPQWLVTTARHEAVHLLQAQARLQVRDPHLAWPGPDDAPLGRQQPAAVDADLLAAERREALLTALAELPENYRRLLVLLVSDPRPSYAQVAEQLGIPIGGIGPSRRRALRLLRASPALQGLAEIAASQDGRP